MYSVKISGLVQQLFTAGMVSIVCVPLIGCAADDMSDVATLQPYGGSKQHPIVIKNGEAHVADCGIWTENLAVNDQNTLAPNHGCAVQSNIATMAVYPEDLAGGNRPLPPTLGDAGASAVSFLYGKKEN